MILDQGAVLEAEVVEPVACAKEAFGAEFLSAIRPLRAALLRLLEEWGSPETPKEFQRTAGVGWTICWQVFRIVKAEDLAAEAKHAPTPASLKRLLQAAAKAGVSRETTDAVKFAAEEFAQFTKRMAADRAAFESMVSGLVPDENGEKISISHRRAAFRAMGNIMGRQTELVYSSVVVKRSDDGDGGGQGTDGLMYQVQRGVTRFRADSRIRVYSYNTNPSGVPGEVQSDNSLDPEATRKYGMPILPEFSTSPFPRANKKISPTGDVTYWIDGTELGARGAFNVAICRFGRKMPLMVDEDGRKLFHLTVAVHKPIAVTVQELLVHRPSFPNCRVEMLMYSASEGGATTQTDVQSLPQYATEEKLSLVGPADRVGIAEFPEYGEMLRQGAETAGWDLSEFDVWRVKMPYPIITSAIRLFFYVD